MPHEPVDLGNFEELANRYAAELTAQFRTLSLFTTHAGEIGRSHEIFVGQTLARFLPATLRIGTGFVLSSSGVTRQQDIIVYDWQRFPVLLSIGDCVVVDGDAVAATVEVKTRLDSRGAFLAEVRKLSDQERVTRSSIAVGLYAWEGLALSSALECFWELIGEREPLDLSPLPAFVYVRNSYLIVPNFDGRLATPPLHVLRLGQGGATEGVGLLALVARLWRAGVQDHANWPWWLQAWDRERGFASFEPVEWPAELQTRAHWT